MSRVSIFYVFLGVFFHSLAHIHGVKTTTIQHPKSKNISTDQQFEQLLANVAKLVTQVDMLNVAMTGLQNLATIVAALDTATTKVDKLSPLQIEALDKAVNSLGNKVQTLKTSLELVKSKVKDMGNFVQHSPSFKPSIDGIIISYGSGFVTKALNPNGPQLNIKADENFAVQHVAFDWNTRKVYFASTDDGIKRGNLDGTNIERLIPESGHALAVDSLSGNFYYGNNQQGSAINVCDRNGRHCSPIAKEQTELHSIALHIPKRLIFWTNGSCIVRANMDGTDTRIIIPQSASAIGVDEDTDQLFWGQSGDLIGSQDLNGKDPRVIRSRISLLDGIAVNGQTVYYTAEEQGASVDSVNKDGSNHTVVPVSLPSFGRHIALYGKKLSEVSQNPCESSHCAHVCVPKVGSYICLCPEGKKLEKSSGNCV